MRRRRRCGVRAGLALVCLVVIGTAGAAGATAASEDPGLTVETDGGPMFDATDFGRTLRADGSVVVRSTTAGELRVRATHVTSDDNGCNEPEEVAGDHGCGPGEGELADAASVEVRDSGLVVWFGPLTALAEPGFSAGPIGAGEVRRLDWQLRVSPGVGNEVQGDSIAFGIEFGLDGSSAGGSAVLSSTEVRGLGELPRTGLPAGLRAAVSGLGLVVVGSLLLLLVRRVRPAA